MQRRAVVCRYTGLSATIQIELNMTRVGRHYHCFCKFHVHNRRDVRVPADWYTMSKQSWDGWSDPAIASANPTSTTAAMCAGKVSDRRSTCILNIGPRVYRSPLYEGGAHTSATRIQTALDDLASSKAPGGYCSQRHRV